MNSQAGIICLWASAAVLLIAVFLAGSVILWKRLKSLKNFLFALSNKARQNQELLNGLQVNIGQIQSQLKANQTMQTADTNQTAVADAVGKNIVLSGKIRTEMTAYHAAVMEILQSLKTGSCVFPAKILDTVLPLNNNDGSTYGFKIPLSDGGVFIAVIHSLQKDDRLKNPEIARYHYTLMLYDAKGELVDVRANPVVQEKQG